MKTDYEKIDPEDRDSIIWLQLVLARLMPGPGGVAVVGELAPPTEKAIRLYQIKHQLTQTGKPDQPTLEKMRQELKERKITP